MENASKALIIAGAILLSILIISLGIMVFQNARKTVGGANLDATQIEAFNSKWEQFSGKNKTSAEVQSLFSAAIANNASERKLGTNRYIEVVDSTGGLMTGTLTINKDTATPEVPTALSNSNPYEVTPSYDANGLINKLTITKQS